MTPSALLRVARKISRLLHEQRLAHALTGNLALRLHGLDRCAGTIEFVVSGDASIVIEHLKPGTTLSTHTQRITVTADGVDVAFLSSGHPLRRSDLLCPTTHAGLPVLGLNALVSMKVTTGRSANARDIIELLELGNVSVGDVTNRLSGDDPDRFRALLTIVELERQRRPKEARRILVAMLANSARP
jgi:hypothetical protein